MVTIKLPIKTNNDSLILDLMKQYSCVVRYAYNRFVENKHQKEIRLLCKSLSHIQLLNSWLVQCAILQASYLFKSKDNQKLIFGGRNNLKLRLQNKISKEQYKYKRLMPISSQGQTLQKGNRMFTLNIINNNEVVFKINKKCHISIILPKLKKNFKQQLFNLQLSKNITYSVKLSDRFITFSFQQKKEQITLNQNKFLGIDLNPCSIGVSISQNKDNKINTISTFQYNLSKLISNIKNNKKSSNDKSTKNLNNKLNHQLFQISKNIVQQAKFYQCKFVFIEGLSIQNKNHTKGHKFNRLINNLWKRNILISNLKKRLSIYNIKLFQINPAYTSFIGNLTYDFTDPINASIQIARRGFEVIIIKNKKFYPELNSIKDQWKKYLIDNCNSWKIFFDHIKNSKVKYRISLNQCKHLFKVFRLNNYKSNVDLYKFTNNYIV